jgi:hypothetical protein
MKKPSGSNIEPLVECGASHVLPQNDRYLEHTIHGTDGHDLLAGVINRRPGAAAKLAKQYPDLGFRLEEYIGNVSGAAAEEAYVIDLERRTSRYLGKEIGRKYEEKLGRALAPCEIGTSLDFHATRKGMHIIRDWKFGRYSSWWQLFVQSMAVLWSPTANGATEVDAGFIHILTAGEDGEEETVTYEDQATVYLMDLDDRAQEIVTAIKRAQAMEGQADPPTREGKWCEYCAAYPHCPAKWKMVRYIGSIEPNSLEGMVNTLTPEQCGAAYKKLGEIEKNIIERYKKVLRHRMKVEGGFPLASGKVLKVIQMPGRDSLDRPALMALLREKGATTAEISACFKTGAPFDMVKEKKA